MSECKMQKTIALMDWERIYSPGATGPGLDQTGLIPGISG